jgi:glycosidase
MTPSEENLKRYFPLALQISAEAWDRYGLTPDLLRAGPSPLYPLRVLATRLQRKSPGHRAGAGHLNLLALLNSIFRFVAGRYLELRRCSVGMDEVLTGSRRVAPAALTATLENFPRFFPPAAVLLGSPLSQFLGGTQGPDNRRLTLIELFLLAVQTENPAAADIAELFDDGPLRQTCPYRETLAELDRELARESTPGLLGGSLLELLAAPLRAAPSSLVGQLRYIRENWSGILPSDLLKDILTAFAVLQEEEQVRGGGPGPIPVPRFGRGADYGYEEPERFSPDWDWMSNVVLLAKTIYVWLDQLGKKYGRSITSLDQIPDEELDLITRWGFTSLWLIGIWERSPASQKIKQIMGNPEAVSSAYSLYDYVVARDLGGEEAMDNLYERCRLRGIRLGCDVVPNHTGIYSRWVREHPDWFIQLDYPPYPGYRFTGPDLSFDGDIGIQIEDGYWNHSDAAVVFRHEDHLSGKVRYLYHGNDGTHLPWNDTAQLNFLLPEVREAMIRTILGVARKYKIIRFDAAMTLAKKHFQRLWFPQPGGGSGVPSRAEHAMSREEFERLFPVEFWREVVDRVAAEVPDTLLLAEAFWLMEGYFVRTLGMHRVYNSAFMNMLKTEDNAKYRDVIKNILDFNPEILKRFVNFMNNPDEDTAVAQFGTGDKYFGVAVLLVTMPGLPMFGHGQVEGLREKYGMEYRKAYWDEKVDEAMVRHHENQIFPLMRRRHLFSGSENFVFYDFYSGGHVNEDVFAFSNGSGKERALVVFHNRYADTGGWISQSVPKRVKTPEGGEQVVRPGLAEALGLNREEGYFCRFRDHRNGLEYLRRSREIAEGGLYLQLGPFGYQVFLDIREVRDEDGCWSQVFERLQGRGASDLDHEIRKVRHGDLIEAFGQAISRRSLAALGTLFASPPARQAKADEAFHREADGFFRLAARKVGFPEKGENLAKAVLEDLAAARELVLRKSRRKAEREALAVLAENLSRPAAGLSQGIKGRFSRVFLPWMVLHRLGELAGPEGSPGRTASWMEEFLLAHTLQGALQAEREPPFNLPPHEAAGEALLVLLLVRHQSFAETGDELRRRYLRLLEDTQVGDFLGFNWYGGVCWLNRERLETLNTWLFIASALSSSGPEIEPKKQLERMAEIHQFFDHCLKAAERAQYQAEKFREFL